MEPIDTLENLGWEINLCDYEDVDLTLQVILTCPDGVTVDRISMRLQETTNGRKKTVHKKREGVPPYMLGGDDNWRLNDTPELKMPGRYRLRVIPEPGARIFYHYDVVACDR